MTSKMLSAGVAVSKKDSNTKLHTTSETSRPSKRKADDSDKPNDQQSTKKRAISNGKIEKSVHRRVEITPTLNKAPSRVLNVLIFGEGENSELGLGPSRTESKTPRLNPFLDPKKDSTFRIVQVSCGGMHTVALTADNKIITWGVNDAGALGRSTDWNGGLRDIDDEEEDTEGELNPLESTPSEVSSHHFEADTRFAQVAAGDNSTFVLTTAGTVYGWGTFRNAQGDECFGYDKEAKRISRQETPLLIPGIKDVIQIACGTNHALALDKNGHVWGWGINDENQLGRRLFGRHQNSYVPQHIRVCRGKATYIASGQCHSFAIDQSGDVWVWGRNSNWEAGYTDLDARDHAPCLQYPVKITQLAGVNVTSLSGGGSHSCAVTADGRCFTWGKMSTGQLGIAFTAEQLQDETLIRRGIRDQPEICTRPTPVLGIGNIAVAACGTDHTIFVNSDGKVYTSGFGFQGQLGLGSDEDADVATQITSKSVKERNISWAGAGGGFSIIAEIVN